MARGDVLQLALPGGAAVRVRGDPAGDAPSLLLLGGSTHRDPGGAWSATAEWLARRIHRAHPRWSVAEVRYRRGSGRPLAAAVEDAHAAIATLTGLGRAPRVLVGFSLGGRVAVALGRAESVRTVVGLAPWLPDGADLRPLIGRTLHLAHGTFDRPLPGLAGVSPGISRAAAARAAALGAPAELTLIRGGVHGVAARAPWGGLLPLPRAGRWARFVTDAAARDAIPALPAGPPPAAGRASGGFGSARTGHHLIHRTTM